MGSASPPQNILLPSWYLVLRPDTRSSVSTSVQNRLAEAGQSFRACGNRVGKQQVSDRSLDVCDTEEVLKAREYM